MPRGARSHQGFINGGAAHAPVGQQRARLYCQSPTGRTASQRHAPHLAIDVHTQGCRNRGLLCVRMFEGHITNISCCCPPKNREPHSVSCFSRARIPLKIINHALCPASAEHASHRKASTTLCVLLQPSAHPTENRQSHSVSCFSRARFPTEKHQPHSVSCFNRARIPPKTVNHTLRPASAERASHRKPSTTLCVLLQPSTHPTENRQPHSMYCFSRARIPDRCSPSAVGAPGTSGRRTV